MAHEQISHLASTSTETQPSCRLLSLAAELRNAIYELSFNEISDEPVDLSMAQPPSKALLLTCSAISSEVSLIYKHAYRKYWTETSFTLHDPYKPSKSIIDAVSAIRDEDCDHIASIKVTEDLIDRPTLLMLWAYLEKGFWEKQIQDDRKGRPYSSSYYAYMSGRPGLKGRVYMLTDLEELKIWMAKESVRPASIKKMLQDYILMR
ncbi:hypothetical protein LTR17_002221 [Elasticomyces elasticus]|nr:hypothetical protein LTR17_002221 [Elasticomyces elasticus]